MQGNLRILFFVIIQCILVFQSRNSLKGIVFVIDSSTFGKKSRDVAALLYDVLYESEKKVPVLIACNKQDCSLAKSSQVLF